MPLLGQLFSSLFAAAVASLFRLFGAKVAVRMLAISGIAALGATLLAVFNGLVAPMAAALFTTAYGQLLGLVFPPISGTVVTGLVALWIACAVYRLKLRAIGIASSV